MYHLLLGTLKTSHNGTVPKRSIMTKQHQFAAYCLKQPSGVKCCRGRHLSSGTELISVFIHPPHTWGFLWQVRKIQSLEGRSALNVQWPGLFLSFPYSTEGMSPVICAGTHRGKDFWLLWEECWAEGSEERWDAEGVRHDQTRHTGTPALLR